MKVLIVLALFGAVATASPFISFGGSLSKVNALAQAGIAKGQNATGAILGLSKVAVSAPLSAAKDITSGAIALGQSAADFGKNAAKKGIQTGQEIADQGFGVVASLGMGTVASYGKQFTSAATNVAEKAVDQGVNGAKKAMGMVNSTAQAILDGTLAANEKANSVMVAGSAMGHAVASNMVTAGVNAASSAGQTVGSAIASVGNQIKEDSVIPAASVTVDADVEVEA